MPRTALLALLALLLPFCTTTASVPREKYEIEDAGLGGTWRLTAITRNGVDKPTPKEDVWHLRVKHNLVHLTGKKVWAYYRIDPRHRPAHIDRLSDGIPRTLAVTRGIYRLSGNRLTICLGITGVRPKAFVSTRDRDILFQLVRLKGGVVAMRLLCYAAALCLAAVPATGAAPSPTPKATIVGVWEFVKSDDRDAPPPGTTLEFTRDGKLQTTVTQAGKRFRFQATYTIAGDRLTVKKKGPDGKEKSETATITKLTDTEWHLKDAKGQTSEFKRKK